MLCNMVPCRMTWEVLFPRFEFDNGLSIIINMIKKRIFKICNWIQSDRIFLVSILWGIVGIYLLYISELNFVLKYFTFVIYVPSFLLIYCISGIIIKRFHEPAVGLFSTYINKQINSSKITVYFWGGLWLSLIILFEIYVHLYFLHG